MTAIRSATPEDLPAVGNLIAYAFNDLDANVYLVPALAERLAVMAEFFTLLTVHAASHGRVDVIDSADGKRLAGNGPAGCAVWFDRTGELPEPAHYDSRLQSLAGVYLDRFQALDELFEKHHPLEAHWHLAFLAVHPEVQDKGLGSALMARTHDELDKAGIPAYLEATNPENIRLYRRHGYTDMLPFEILLPDGTPFFRMWRPAR